jgi:hypothetical protein
MRTTRITTVPITALLSAAVLAAPAAAVPTDVISGGSTSCDPQPIVQRTVAVRAQSSGFDWASAGIGAAGGVGAFAIALAGTTGMRRRRPARPQSVATH